MHQAFRVHALADASLPQQIDHALFQHAGTDAREDVIGVFAFDDDVGDAGTLQQLAEQ
jgi:hypothetical protein